MAQRLRQHLSLMDAGVPIKAPVAGVAMGLIMGEDGKYKVLTDIAGLEDAMGDMDFKVAGTEEGITALQMDIKIQGIPMEVLKDAVAQAREGRLFILEKMLEAIAEPRAEMSPYAPRMYRLQIDPQKIGTVIGPGGRVIRSIIEETGCSVDIEDDGSVFIGATDEESARQGDRHHRRHDEGRGGRPDLHGPRRADHELRRVRRDRAGQGRPGPHLGAGGLPRADGRGRRVASATKCR